MACGLVLAQLRAQMALPEFADAPSLGVLYITDHYAGAARDILDYLGAELPEVTDWSGTVGFGIAHLRWDMAAGAFYLFLINSIFIASATLVVGRILRLPKQQELSERTVKIHRWVITACLLAVLIPSIWQGYRFVQHEYFRSAANTAVKSLMQSERSIVRREIDADERRISLVVVGVVDEVVIKGTVAYHK